MKRFFKTIFVAILIFSFLFSPSFTLSQNNNNKEREPEPQSDFWGEIKNKISLFLNDLVEKGLKKAWEKLKNFGEKVLKKIKELFSVKNLLNKIKTLFQKLWEKAEHLFQKLWEWLKNFLSQIPEEFNKEIKEIKDSF